MAIVAGDIDFFLSGGASNTDPTAALGGARSTTTQVSGSIHGLFDLISSAEALAGDTEYRCLYVYNAHATLTLQNTVIWISSDASGADTDIAIALGGEGVNGTAETVANESTAPVGESFSTPVSAGSGLAIGDIPPLEHYPIWVRRTVNSSSSAATGLSVTLSVQGDTAA